MKPETDTETEQFVEITLGKIISFIVVSYNAISLLAALIQFWIVYHLSAAGDISQNLQILLQVFDVPTVESSYTGENKDVLIGCLVAHVFSCACVIYVAGRAWIEPKYAAGSPELSVKSLML